jgi:hypothetical protein
MPNLSKIVNQLQAQRNDVQRELARLDAAINALRGFGTTNGAGKIRPVLAKPRRTMSASARKRIAAAQRARWAAWKAKQKKAAA